MFLSAGTVEVVTGKTSHLANTSEKIEKLNPNPMITTWSQPKAGERGKR